LNAHKHVQPHFFFTNINLRSLFVSVFNPLIIPSMAKKSTA
jgi:hypothetical protein